MSHSLLRYMYAGAGYPSNLSVTGTAQSSRHDFAACCACLGQSIRRQAPTTCSACAVSCRGKKSTVWLSPFIGQTAETRCLSRAVHGTKDA